MQHGGDPRLRRVRTVINPCSFVHDPWPVNLDRGWCGHCGVLWKKKTSLLLNRRA